VTTFLVVLFLVVAFVVGQVSMLRPSRRDLFLISLRSEARKLGLHPRLLPPPEWYRGERPSGGLLACYSLLIEEGQKGLPYFRAERLSDGEWVTRAGDKGLVSRLALPAETEFLIAIEAQANSVSLWWMESQGPEALPALLSLMREVIEKNK